MAAKKKEESFFDIAEKNAKKYNTKTKSGMAKAAVATMVETPVAGMKQGARKLKGKGVCSTCHGKKR